MSKVRRFKERQLCNTITCIFTDKLAYIDVISVSTHEMQCASAYEIYEDNLLGTFGFSTLYTNK